MKNLYERITADLLSSLALTLGEKTYTEHIQTVTERGARCEYQTGDDGVRIALDVHFTPDAVIFILMLCLLTDLRGKKRCRLSSVR